MYYGVAYYPEHWPETRWPVDARLMAEAGINGVRMGEFAWSRIEPEQGQYDFDWLDQAIALLSKHGVKTMLCTCSRTPPPWVFSRYPEIRNVGPDGRVSNYGHRYTVCHNNPTFVKLSQQIDRAIVEHYAGNPDVIAWHIDNEIGSGNTCYCDVCRARFIDDLRHRYGTVAALNEAWGAHFWSFAFNRFADVPLPVGVRLPNPSLSLAYARFQSKVNADFARWRYDLIKSVDPETWVTTNFQTSARTHTDIFDLGAATDVYGTNFYPPFAPEFALDYCRGARGELLILEQRAGHPHWDQATEPGWMRLWAYRSIAHGACGINFFRWRPCRWGQEEYWHGILPHTGRKNRRYAELKQMGQELQVVGELIDTTRPDAEVAIVMSYEARWALNAVLDVRPPFNRKGLTVHEAAVAYHSALMRHNITADALDPREDLSQYKLVFAPRLYALDDAVVENLQTYVAQGGILCLTPRSGVADAHNTIFAEPAPGPLADVAGVLVDDYGSLKAPLALRTHIEELGAVDKATLWADEIATTTATPLASYAEGWQSGIPAITLNETGKGKVIYVGTALRGPALEAFVAWLCALSNVTPGPATPQAVRVYERRNQQLRLRFLLNFGPSPETVTLEEPWTDAFTGASLETVILQPAEVRIVQRTLS